MSLKFNPADDYENLLKQARSLHSLYESAKRSESLYRNRAGDYSAELKRVGEDSINEQLENNERLTNLLLAAEDRMEKLSEEQDKKTRHAIAEEIAAYRPPSDCLQLDHISKDQAHKIAMNCKGGIES